MNNFLIPAVSLLVLLHVIMIARILRKPAPGRQHRPAREPLLLQIVIFGIGIALWRTGIMPVMAMIIVWVLEKKRPCSR